MTFRFLTPNVHGLLDYAAAAALIVLPLLLDLDEISPLAQWLSVAAGFGLIGYSLVTSYAFGVVSLLPFRVHLALDLAAGVAFLLAPFLFGWSGLVLGYYLVMGAAVIAVVAVTDGGLTRLSRQTAA